MLVSVFSLYRHFHSGSVLPFSCKLWGWPNKSESLWSLVLKQKWLLTKSNELNAFPRFSKDKVARSHRLVLETYILFLKNMAVSAFWWEVRVSGAILSHQTLVTVKVNLDAYFRSCLLLKWFGECSKSVGTRGPFLAGVAQTYECCIALQSRWHFVFMAVEIPSRKPPRTESWYNWA